MSQDSGAEVGAVTKDGDAELVKDYHVNTPEPTEEHKAAEVAFLTEMERWKRWGEIEDTVKARITYDAQRILRARNFNINNSVVLAQQTAEFFSVEKPFGIGPEEMEKEAATGKVRLGGIDRHHRPVVVLDNTVENTTEQSGQMRFLLFNMEYSILHMKPPVEKQVVFINLEAFSIWNAPALSTTKITLDIFAKYYCERLGTAILWQPPAYFTIFLGMCSPFIDPVTRSKIVLVRGEYDPGSKNDTIMQSLLGKDWKAITGIDGEIFDVQSSPGYDHATYWPALAEKLPKLRGKND